MFPFIRLLNARRNLFVRQAFSVPDIAVVCLVVATLIVIGQLSHSPVRTADAALTYRVSLNPAELPLLAARSTLRMFIGLAVSLVFAVMFGTIAARVHALEALFVSLLDVLQSVPVLAFIAASASFFINAFPHSVIGLECLSIFAVFSSQAWNMGFSYYQSLKTQPRDLGEAAEVFRLNRWNRFSKIDMPSGAIGLVWNAMMSFGGGWFFVAYSEAVTVNNQNYVLPGLGSYLAEAVRQRDVFALVGSVAMMVVLLLVVDQLFWRPLVAWSERFRMDKITGAYEPTRSWFLSLLYDARLPKLASKYWTRWVSYLPKFPKKSTVTKKQSFKLPIDGGLLTGIILGLLLAAAGWKMVTFLQHAVTLQDVGEAAGLTSLTFLRVAIIVILASMVWVPVGIFIGLNTQVAKRVMPVVLVLSAFPTNFVFPLVTVFFVRYHIGIDFGSVFLLTLGAQWYVLFNVIAGAASIPLDMRQMADVMGLKGWEKWKKLYLPAIFPSWVAGAVTASGGAWNASIVCEYVQWGDGVMKAHGIGSYITEMSQNGNQEKVLFGAAVMCVFVVATNRLLWQRLSNLAESRYGMS